MSGKMPTICLVAGEESGDQLGSELMKALNERLGSGVRYCGVGGERMLKLGFTSFFNMSDVSVMGLSAVLARLPLIVRRVYQTVDAIVAADPGGYKEMARSDVLSGKCWSTPAYSDGKIYVRSTTEAACIEIK